MKKFSTIIFSLFVSGAFTSNAELNLPVRKIGGEDYYYRQVKKKETIYGISKELGITKEDIIKYNPSVASGLQRNQILYFPVKDFKKESSANVQKASNTSVTHLVKSGETLFGIARTYGISIADLVEANPSTKSGLKSGQQLTIPSNTTKIDGDNQQSHYVVKPGDTLYRIALNHNVTLEELLQNNPGITPDNFKAGETIVIPSPNSELAAQNKEPETIFVSEKIEKGETFQSISKEYKVSEQQIREANPNVKELKSGKFVSIPISQKDESELPTQEDVQMAYNTVHEVAENTDSIVFSFILPFEKEDNRSKLYVDFYKGFLMAVEQNADKETKIAINAFDTSNNSISQILSEGRLSESHAIFAAGEDYDFDRIADYAKEKDINIVNAFSVNNDSYFENDRVIQINTPSSYMYSAYIKTLKQKFPDYQVIVINDTEHEEKALVKHVQESGISYSTLSIDDINNPEELESLTSKFGKIAFLPSSGSKSTVRAIQGVLTRLKKEKTDTEITLLGYPEWTTYHDLMHFFHAMNTYVYSRYALIPNGEEVRKLNNEYNYWYGGTPIYSVPSMASVGYDLGCYFIHAIKDNNNDFNVNQPFDGVQTGIVLNRVSNWSGFINTAIYLLNFDINGQTTKELIL